MRILQLNLNHCQAAQNLLKQSVRELNVDLTLLSEPYQCEDSTTWVSDNSKTSAIWSTSGLILRDPASQYCGFARANVNGIYFYSCYIPPRYSLPEFEQIVHTMVYDANSRGPVVIAGDFNAWATEWGCPSTNHRGQVLVELLATLDVVLLNRGSEHTFSTGRSASIIDVTFASASVAHRLKWSVSDLYTNSDHRAVMIETIQRQQPSVLYTQPGRISGWKVDTLDKELFGVAIEDMSLQGQPEVMAEQLICKVNQACNTSMIRRKRSPDKQPVYWWNVEISQLRTECIQARRQHTRSRGTAENDSHREYYRLKRKALKLAIRRSKRKCFLQICDEVEDNPWGLAYQLVTKRLKCLKPSPPKDAYTLEEIVKHLFPRQNVAPWQNDTTQEVFNSPAVSFMEIKEIIDKFENKKAPGLDGIPNVVIKETFKRCPNQIIHMMDACMQHGTFPRAWKRQKLVLLPKEGKPLENPSSYRPLCMIDTFGKLLESLVCRRLEQCIDAVGGLSDNQFGFRKSRSTLDAINVIVDTASQAIEGKRWKNGSKEYCVVVTLDVKNAFNSANWEIIVNSLANLNIPRYLLAVVKDYFRNRILIYDTNEGTRRYKITSGVPQGSVLGPLLWNVMYDGILRLALPNGVKIVGYADDIALISVAKHITEITTITNISIEIVRMWLGSVGLRLADHKTEALLISSRKSMETIKLNVGSCCIETKPAIKYLGVMIDNRLSFKDHLLYIAMKSSRTCSALSRIMPNTRGPKYQRRRLLAGVVKSIIIYASPIWSGSLRFATYRNIINPIFRLTALRVCCAFRTVSDEAALVIAGMMPIDLQIRSSDMSVDGVTEWQNRWTISGNGRWTYSLIPDIIPWIERKHGDLDFYVTQMLSGHGCFRSYLKRFGHDSSPFCPSCDGNVVEDAAHVFFSCPRFDTERTYLEEVTDCTIRQDNIVSVMLSSLGNWEYVCQFTRLVLTELRRLERVRNERAEID